MNIPQLVVHLPKPYPHSPVAEQGLKRLTVPRPRKPGSSAAALRGRGKTRAVGTVSLMLPWPEKVLKKG